MSLSVYVSESRGRDEGAGVGEEAIMKGAVQVLDGGCSLSLVAGRDVPF